MIFIYNNFAGEKFFNTSDIKMICGYDNFAGKKTLKTSGILMICSYHIFAGEKISGSFADNYELRLRQIYRSKYLWTFLGHRWFLAKTILQPKNHLEFSGILMICSYDNLQTVKFLKTSRTKVICGYDNFAGEKFFENFRDNDDLQLRQCCRQKETFNISKILMICSYDNFHAINFLNNSGKKGLRLKQCCRSKQFAIIPGYWYFAVKTVLRVKSISIFPG